MRGRWPSGPEYIDQLSGAVEEKERLKTILATLSGDKRVLEACAELGIGETRFHQLRNWPCKRRSGRWRDGRPVVRGVWGRRTRRPCVSSNSVPLCSVGRARHPLDQCGAEGRCFSLLPDSPRNLSLGQTIAT
jgi:hypothetical protein